MKEHNTTYNYYTEYTSTIAHIGNRKVICSYCKHVLFVDMRAKWEEYLQNRTICWFCLSFVADSPAAATPMSVAVVAVSK